MLIYTNALLSTDTQHQPDANDLLNPPANSSLCSPFLLHSSYETVGKKANEERYIPSYILHLDQRIMPNDQRAI